MKHLTSPSSKETTETDGQLKEKRIGILKTYTPAQGGRTMDEVRDGIEHPGEAAESGREPENLGRAAPSVAALSSTISKDIGSMPPAAVDVIPPSREMKAFADSPIESVETIVDVPSRSAGEVSGASGKPAASANELLTIQTSDVVAGNAASGNPKITEIAKKLIHSITG